MRQSFETLSLHVCFLTIDEGVKAVDLDTFNVTTRPHVFAFLFSLYIFMRMMDDMGRDWGVIDACADF